MINYQKPDLTQHPPRSARVRLGGYVHLPRMLDKFRAHAAGKIGEYHYNCPLDQAFFGFTGIDHEKLFAEVKTGKTDTEMLGWVEANTKRQPHEIEVWSRMREVGPPNSAGAHGLFNQAITGLAKDREDIGCWFELLDLDDYVTFGGKG